MLSHVTCFLLRVDGQAALTSSAEFTPTHRVCRRTVPADTRADADHEDRLRPQVLASNSSTAVGRLPCGVEVDAKVVGRAGIGSAGGLCLGLGGDVMGGYNLGLVQGIGCCYCEYVLERRPREDPRLVGGLG